MEAFEFLKVFVCSVIVVIIMAAVVCFAILVIDALDGINKKLITIIKLLRTSHQASGRTIPEVKSNEEDTKEVGSVDKSDDSHAVAY